MPGPGDILTFPGPSCTFYLFKLVHPHQAGALKRSVVIAKFRSSRREAVAKLKSEDIDYKRLDVLVKFITPTGKIESARRTGATRKQQTRVVRAIKRARFLALVPHTLDDTR